MRRYGVDMFTDWLKAIGLYWLVPPLTVGASLAQIFGLSVPVSLPWAIALGLAVVVIRSAYIYIGVAEEIGELRSGEEKERQAAEEAEKERRRIKGLFTSVVADQMAAGKAHREAIGTIPLTQSRMNIAQWMTETSNMLRFYDNQLANTFAPPTEYNLLATKRSIESLTEFIDTLLDRLFRLEGNWYPR